MAITSALVLYAVLWFLTLLIVIPIRLKTQGDVGEIVHGTHAGAPHEPQMKKRALITTVVSFVLWVIIASIIISGTLTVRDLDWFDRMGPSASETL
jgi:predicted secreted protein